MFELKNILIESMGLKPGYYNNMGHPMKLEEGQRFCLRTSELVNRFNKSAYKPINKSFIHHLIEKGWLKTNGFIITNDGKKINTYGLNMLFKLLLWFKENGEAVTTNGKHMLKPKAEDYFNKWSGQEKTKPNKKDINNKKFQEHLKQRSWYDSSENKE